MRKNIKHKLFFFLLLFFLLGANFVYALEITYPRVPGAIPPQDFVKTALSEDFLSLYIKYLFNLTIWLAGIIALGALVYGGTLYVISTGKPDRMVSAKDQISAAFLGLLLLLASYLILNVLNPEFLILRISSFEKIELIERRDVPSPSIEGVYSSIHAELPFGRIIERIFETYISDLPNSVVKTPRIVRIKTLAEETNEIVDNLTNQSEQLKKAANRCRCEILRPDPPCNHYGCHSCPPEYCTSDPCKNVRGEIQSIEQNNLTQINELTLRQKKTITEASDLKKELERLERVESFIRACPFAFKNSYSKFLSLKQSYEEEKGIVREISFWDDIIIFYLNKENEIVPDWATFLCTIGGNILSSTRALHEEESEEIVVKEEPEACSAEIPVGEIIDRTKRVTRLLINRLETLIEWDKKMIDAVDELQVLVSQCSSRRCIPRCVCVSCGHDCEYCVEIGCFGDPCPSIEIAEQLDEIQKIQKEINKIITETKKEEIGVIPLIDPDDPDSVVSRILVELDKIQKLGAGTRGIRYPLQICETEKDGKALLTCNKAGGNIDPEGKTIRTCCMDELVFQECLEECYLEEGVEKYKICLQECLNQKSEEAKARGIPRPEEIAQCRHLLNFFCCTK